MCWDIDHPLNVGETGDVTGDKGLGENAGVVRIDYSVELRKIMKSNNTGVSWLGGTYFKKNLYSLTVDTQQVMGCLLL